MRLEMYPAEIEEYQTDKDCLQIEPGNTTGFWFRLRFLDNRELLDRATGLSVTGITHPASLNTPNTYLIWFKR